MDRGFRDDQLGRANQKAIKRTALLDGLDREYTLNEIAIITRAGPARRLGLRDKGHLGIGADADVTIYHDRADREEMFATPRYVIKGGELVVEEGDLRRVDDGRLLSSSAPFDVDIDRVLKPLFADRYTVSFDHYPVRDPALREPAVTVEASAVSGYELGGARGRRHVCRGVRHALHAARDHRRQRRLGAGGGALGDGLRHLGDRLQMRGGDRTAAVGRARPPTGDPGSRCCCSRWTARGSRHRVLDRVGQSVMTCPTTACFDGWPDGDKTVPMGKSLRYFGDGFQASKVIAGERFWRIPVLSGEFLVADTVGVGRGVGGGNLIVAARDEPRRADRRARPPSRRCAATGSRCRSPAGSSAAAARSAR